MATVLYILIQNIILPQTQTKLCNPINEVRCLFRITMKINEMGPINAEYRKTKNHYGGDMLVLDTTLNYVRENKKETQQIEDEPNSRRYYMLSAPEGDHFLPRKRYLTPLIKFRFYG